MNYEREIDKAVEIVKKARERIMPFYDPAIAVEIKADDSPVTMADREGEACIAALLQDYFPDDGLLGEEGMHVPSRSGRRWLIDPIDGTKDFIRGNPYWCIQLALQTGTRSNLGIVYCPCTDELLVASDGNGCYWNGTRLAASHASSLNRSILMVSGFNAIWESWGADAVHSLTQRCWTVRCYGGSYDVILFARGKADIWLSGRGMEWDYAPAQVIARECGGCLLTQSGTDHIDDKHCIVCSLKILPEVRHLLNIPA